MMRRLSLLSVSPKVRIKFLCTPPLLLAWPALNRVLFQIRQLSSGREGAIVIKLTPLLESTINMVLSLCGGKKKRKKKVYTKPKKIGHKHKKRPKAILEYFNVDNTGKIVKLKIECEKCPPATYMADHPDRHTCGKCGNMFYKLTKDGKRLPIPKQNKP
jgi:ubiquitin-small subunit ribosomal protein S27Ae